MSIVRILLGIGGLSATAAGIWFGLDKKKEDDLYQVKMTKFRGTAKKINESLVQQQLGELKVHDPEHWVWEKKFNSYVSQDWSDSRLKDIPPEIRNNAKAFRDFCFGKLDENANDLKDNGFALSSGSLSPEKMFWDYCLATDLELSQLQGKK